MKKNILSLGMLLVFFVVLFSSCNPESDKPDDIDIVEEVDEFVYPIPTPFEITQMLENSGTAFIIDLTNNKENAKSYFSEKSKALNLGVYGADLSYTSTYNMTQETRELLACSRILTDGLEISSMFNESLVGRVEENLENKDSLYKIVSESYYDTFGFLNNNGKGEISVIILAGGWIEGIYLATQLASMSMEQEQILLGLAEQKITVNSLIPLLENYKDNKDVAEVLDLVKQFKEIFDKVEQKDEALFMNEDTFNELLTLAEEIRAEITAI